MFCHFKTESAYFEQDCHRNISAGRFGVWFIVEPAADVDMQRF